jgi:uncharacterized phage protein gp47/JayE
MAYFPPYIDKYGIHIPTYSDILNNYIAQMREIFGSDIYLEEDAQDYQQLSIFAKAVEEALQFAVMVYNNKSPNNAVGIGLADLYTLVGGTIKTPTHSTVMLTIEGTENTVINNGKAKDINGNIWILPDTVTIPAEGMIEVIATSEKLGPVQALPGDINMIYTPVFGWRSVTNNTQSDLGVAPQTDAEIRAAYANHTFIPSRTVLEGIQAAIFDIPEVTRARTYENPTNEYSKEGFPPHSIIAVVEGGEEQLIANAYCLKKTPGALTYGDIAKTVNLESGQSINISFFRPEYMSLKVQVNIKPLSNYNDETTSQIKQNILEYINGLNIGESILNSMLWSVALNAIDSTYPSFSITSITVSVNGKEYTSNDVELTYKQVAQTTNALINVIKG